MKSADVLAAELRKEYGQRGGDLMRVVAEKIVAAQAEAYAAGQRAMREQAIPNGVTYEQQEAIRNLPIQPLPKQQEEVEK